MQFFGKRATIYVTLFLALFLCGSAECQPLASCSVVPAENPSDNPVFGLSNLLDVKENLFVPQEVNISQEKNLMIVWTDQENLKALNLMSIHGSEQLVNVIGLPIHQTIPWNGDNKLVTFGDANCFATPVAIFCSKGREGLAKIVEQEVGTTVDYYIQVDQVVFEKIGAMIGTLDLGGQAMPVAEAFEETPVTRGIGCENIIRSLAGKMTEPDTLVKLPHLAYILATEVETNMGIMDILRLYRSVHSCGANNIYRIM